MAENKYWKFLEELRESGIVNMYGAAPYLQVEFGMSWGAAKSVLYDWMLNYREPVKTSESKL